MAFVTFVTDDSSHGHTVVVLGMIQLIEDTESSVTRNDAAQIRQALIEAAELYAR